MSSREVIAAYRLGAKDSRGRVIQAIFAHFDSYVIYQAENRLEIEGDLGPFDNSQVVQDRVESATALCPDESRARTACFKSIAAALAACMAGDEKTATTLLDKLVARMSQRAVEIGRLFYLAGTVATALLIGLVVLIVYFSQLPARSLPTLLTYMAFFGGLGGTMSVAANLRHIQVNKDSGIAFNVVAGASRGIIAVLAGLFAYLAIKSELMLGVLAESNGLVGLLCGGFVAGFSETLVPNTLRRADGRLENPD